MPGSRLLREVIGVVLPLSCAGCGAPDVPWCGRCAAALRDVARRERGAPRLDRLDGAPPLPVWTAGCYVGAVRRAVPAWKDGGRSDLTGVMVGAARAAARAAAADLRDAGPVAVVPVPSRPSAVRRRGTDLVATLARGVVDELGGPPSAVLRRAVARRGGRDQAGLGARARGRNAGAFRLRDLVGPGARYLLVDDVVTTGATLATCEDLLARAGGTVLGAVAVAATPEITRAALHHLGRGD